MIRVALFVILLCPFLVKAQDLIIEYNYITEVKKYYLVTKNKTKQINRPRVGKFGNVILKGTNYNSFALNHKPTTAYYDEVPIGGGMDSGNPFESSFTSLFGSTLSFSSMFNSSMSMVEDMPFEKKSGEENDDEFGYADTKYSELAELEKSMNENIEGLLAVQNKLDEIVIAEKKIKQLKYNINVTADKIKERADSIMRGLINTEPNVNSTLRFANKLKADLSKNYSNMSANYSLYQALVDEQVQSDDESLGFASSRSRLQAAAKSDLYERNLALASAIVDSAATFNVSGSLQGIYNDYEDIMDNDFAYNYSTSGENNDFLKIKVDHYLKSDLTDGDTAELVKTTNFAIPVRSGLKISPSIGFAFSRFFNGQDTYTMRDTAIIKAQGDIFNPMIAAIINFYPQTGRRISVGGSFGIGIPITGTLSLNFLLGPSIIMGGQQKIILFGGISAGKVERLGEGYKEGDKLRSPFEEIPTTSRYEFGYFAGISYSFSKLDLK